MADFHVTLDAGGGAMRVLVVEADEQVETDDRVSFVDDPNVIGAETTVASFPRNQVIGVKESMTEGEEVLVIDPEDRDYGKTGTVRDFDPDASVAVDLTGGGERTFAWHQVGMVSRPGDPLASL